MLAFVRVRVREKDRKKESCVRYEQTEKCIHDSWKKDLVQLASVGFTIPVPYYFQGLNTADHWCGSCPEPYTVVHMCMC